MKNKVFTSLLTLVLAASAPLVAFNDVTNEIPEISETNPLKGYEKIPNVAQYGEADWSNAVGIARGITLPQAKRIADSNPEVTYFFYTKGRAMVLGTGRGDESWRVFHHGDAVFFSGEPWWGEATGLADGYIKAN